MGNSELVVTLAHYEPGTVHYADYIGGDSSGTGVFDVCGGHHSAKGEASAL